MVDMRELQDDSEGVADDEIVYRRFCWQKAGGKAKFQIGEQCPLSTNHFTDYPDEVAHSKGYAGPCMSVGLRSILIANGFGPEKLLDGYTDTGLASIRVGDLRGLVKGNGDPCPQGVMAAAEDGGPWHAVVFDMTGATRSAAARKAIMRLAKVEIELVRVS